MNLEPRRFAGAKTGGSIGKSLHNLPALKIGFQANRRLLEVQTIYFSGPGSWRGYGYRRFRYANPIVQAFWNAVLMSDLLPAGLSNRQLRAHLAPSLASRRGDTRKAA